MGDEVTLVSSAEECAKDVYKMLARTDLMRPGGDPTYRFLTTGAPDEFETIGRRFLGPELMAAPSSPAACVSSHEAHRVGCSGSYPGPGLAGELLPRSRPTTPTAGPGGCCSTSAAARSARCSGTSTRSTIDAVLLSHLHADHCLDLCGYYVLRKYHPDGAQPRHPGLGPGGHRRTGWPAPTTCPRTRA